MTDTSKIHENEGDGTERKETSGGNGQTAESERLREKISEKEHRIETLEEQNKALEARLDAIEDRIFDDSTEENKIDPTIQSPGISRRGALATMAGLGLLGIGSQPASAVDEHDHLGDTWSGNSPSNHGLRVDAGNTRYGLFGTTSADNGWALLGRATSSSGSTIGAFGRSDSSEGSGVYGIASADSGDTYGVRGRADSPTGDGVYGLATSPTGVAVGVRGQAHSPQGFGLWGVGRDGADGLYGRAYGGGPDGNATGVLARSDAPEGRGVVGFTTSSSGANTGVYGRSESSEGTGVRGWAMSSSGETVGVLGQAQSSNSEAAGVRAVGTNGSKGLDASAGGNYAIQAESTDFSAIRADTDGMHNNAIHGVNTATSGWSWGVRGDTHSESENAFGVRGIAEASSGAATGVSGESAGPDDGAAGVKGHATASSVEAETKGVEGITDADANNAVSPEVVPAGVHGKATGNESTHGVRGEVESLNGRGVAGFATTEAYDHNTFTGSAIGVMGITDRSGDTSGLSDSGGVFGWTTATSGNTYGVLGRNASSDGWGVLAMDTSGEALALRASGDTELSGDTLIIGDQETTGDTELGGELEFADATPQRTAGPIAKGYINADGTIENAVNVNSAQWHSGEERYRINLTNEYYFFNNYATTVTPVQDCTFRITSNSGDMAIEFKDDQGNLIQTMFQFVTHKLPNGVVTNDTDVEALETTTDDGGSGDGAASEGI